MSESRYRQIMGFCLEDEKKVYEPKQKPWAIKITTPSQKSDFSKPVPHFEKNTHAQKDPKFYKLEDKVKPAYHLGDVVEAAVTQRTHPGR